MGLNVPHGPLEAIHIVAQSRGRERDWRTRVQSLKKLMPHCSIGSRKRNRGPQPMTLERLVTPPVVGRGRQATQDVWSAAAGRTTDGWLRMTWVFSCSSAWLKELVLARLLRNFFLPINAFEPHLSHDGCSVHLSLRVPASTSRSWPRVARCPRELRCSRRGFRDHQTCRSCSWTASSSHGRSTCAEYNASRHQG